PSPHVEDHRLSYVSNRYEGTCASTEGFKAGQGGEGTMPTYKDPTDARVLWKLDMMAELGVFPHNLAVCSPLIVGDTLFVITSNGVDEDHIKIPQPAAPSFLALDKKTGEVKWKSNLPTEQLLKPGAKLEFLKNTDRVLIH